MGSPMAVQSPYLTDLEKTMEANVVPTLFERELSGELDSLRRQGERIARTQVAVSMFAGIDLSEVQYVSVWSDGISLDLKPESAKTSTLARVLARHFRTKFVKSKTSDGSSLTMTANVNGIRVCITGYIGVCELVQTEVELTPEEIQEQYARIRRTKVVTTIVCGGKRKPADETAAVA